MSLFSPELSLFSHRNESVYTLKTPIESDLKRSEPDHTKNEAKRAEKRSLSSLFSLAPSLITLEISPIAPRK
jgi:hypothetical protein